MILVELESLESTPIRFLPESESESESESLFPESLQQCEVLSSTVLPIYCDTVGTRENCHNKQLSQ